MSTYLTVRCEGRALELCCWDGETHELVSSAPMPRNDATILQDSLAVALAQQDRAYAPRQEALI